MPSGRASSCCQKKSDDAAGLVIALTPWNDLPKDVQEVVIAMNPAVAAARGRWNVMTQTIFDKSATFFAAIEPRVWDSLDLSTQRQWRTARPGIAAYLAVRSLGMRPEFLEIAEMDDNPVRTAKQYIHNAVALRWALLPGVLRNLLPDQAHAFIAALPTPPPDPGAFFAIASGQADSSMTMHPHTALSTPARLACAVALQRKRPTTIRRLAALLQALVQPVSRPPRIAVPTYVALAHATSAHALDVDGAESSANALRGRGDVFMAMTNALEDNLAAELHPLSEEAAMAVTLRSFARNAPLSARRLAHVLRTKNHREDRQAEEDDLDEAEIQEDDTDVDAAVRRSDDAEISADDAALHAGETEWRSDKPEYLTMLNDAPNDARINPSAANPDQHAQEE